MKMGDITKILFKKWSDNVGLDIQKQIQDFGKEVAYLNQTPQPHTNLSGKL